MLDQETLRKIEAVVKAAPKELQEQRLQEELSKLPPETLKQLQMQQCPFCMMAENKIPTSNIYEDDNYKAILEINPANPGHTLLFPKKHIQNTSELTEIQTKDIFNIANKISKSLQKIFPATNIYVSNGKEAGQRFDHLVIHIIPRKEKDKVSFVWQPQKADPKELEEIKEKIIQNLPKKQIKVKPKEIIEKIDEDKFEKEAVSPKTRIP